MKNDELSINELKKECRKISLKKRRSLTEIQRQEKSKIISSKLLNIILESEFDNIFSYMSYKDEVITHNLVKELLNRNIKVALPKTYKDEIAFYYIKSFDDLKTSNLGILEPIENKCQKAIYKNITIIVPMLAFNDKKYRIGYGGGYYDRFLSYNSKNILAKIGIAYEIQKSRNLIYDSLDIPLDTIITEDNIY